MLTLDIAVNLPEVLLAIEMLPTQPIKHDDAHQNEKVSVQASERRNEAGK